MPSLEYAKINDEGQVEGFQTFEYELNPDQVRKSAFDEFPCLRPVVVRELPRYRQLTQVLDGPKHLVRAGFVERYYDVRDLSQDEVAAVVQDKANADINPTIRLLLFELTNRVRTLEGQPPLSERDFAMSLAGAVMKARA